MAVPHFSMEDAIEEAKLVEGYLENGAVRSYNH